MIDIDIRSDFIEVNEDQRKQENFDGQLTQFACLKLSEYLNKKLQEECIVKIKIINIESNSGVEEIRPSMCNSSTWYNRRWVILRAYYQVLKK